MIKAELVSGDFEDNTMTFEIEGDMILKAGKYTIYTDEENKNLSLSGVVKSLNDKEVKNIEIKSLGDLKRAYPDGTSHTVNSYGRIINYSVDREIVYSRHI